MCCVRGFDAKHLKKWASSACARQDLSLVSFGTLGTPAAPWQSANPTNPGRVKSFQCPDPAFLQGAAFPPSETGSWHSAHSLFVRKRGPFFAEGMAQEWRASLAWPGTALPGWGCSEVLTALGTHCCCGDRSGDPLDDLFFLFPFMKSQFLKCHCILLFFFLSF